MRVYWELEGNLLSSGDNEILEGGTKTQCRKAFNRMTEEEKSKYRFINLQPYDGDGSERLDFDENLYRSNGGR